ncbi:MAG TPA: hypothetical protein VKX17_28725 [Planctomycetota bacterium]|nr:hypothetical protein [Planctomycetota bacterium]
MDTPTLTCEYEGIVEDGQIRLAPDVHLPEKTKVIVLVRDPSRPIRMGGPRLAHREDAKYFIKEVRMLEDKDNAGVR